MEYLASLLSHYNAGNLGDCHHHPANSHWFLHCFQLCLLGQTEVAFILKQSKISTKDLQDMVNMCVQTCSKFQAKSIKK